jgi:hypothetical protein
VLRFTKKIRAIPLFSLRVCSSSRVWLCPLNAGTVWPSASASFPSYLPAPQRGFTSVIRNTLSNNTASLPTELDRNSIQYAGGGGATDAVFSSPPVPDWKGDGPGTVVGLCRAYQPIPVADGL